MSVYSLPSVNHYQWVSFDKTVEHPNLGKIRFLLYGAEEFHGCIGSEFNGIAVLSEHHATILCDRIAQIDTGSFGYTKEQVDQLRELLEMDESSLIDFLNQNDRSRFTITADDFKAMEV